MLATLLPKRLAQTDRRASTASPAIWRTSPTRRCARRRGASTAGASSRPGSEGYRTAEVTLGGVDTRDLDSRRPWRRKAVPGLYFIGEVVDVTGWLGGYNFQWAWSSGWCAGPIRLGASSAAHSSRRRWDRNASLDKNIATIHLSSNCYLILALALPRRFACRQRSLRAILPGGGQRAARVVIAPA